MSTVKSAMAGARGRAARGQPQTVQNFSCRVGRMYCGKNSHPSAASFTPEDVQEENSHHEISPGVVAARRHVLRAPFRFNRIVDVWCGFRRGNRKGSR
jgi:hypothetical protein